MKLLIAEDDLTTQTILKGALLKWGYEVVTANDGEEALAVMSGPNPPLLALVDWLMPGLKGPELCAKIREMTFPVAPYLILLTARDSKDNIVEGLQSGANDYIAKPYDNNELKARVDVGAKMVELQEALVARVDELNQALEHVKTLQGILPICIYCQKIRTDQKSWERIEQYIKIHTEVQFSHCICPDCLNKNCHNFDGS